MPTYVYKFVDSGETIEVQQSFTDASLTEATHPATGQLMAVKKVFTPVGVTFKGGGFYKTDSRGGSPKPASKSDNGDTSGASKPSDAAATSGDSASSSSSSASATANGSSTTSSASTTTASSTASSKPAAPSSASAP